MESCQREILEKLEWQRDTESGVTHQILELLKSMHAGSQGHEAGRLQRQAHGQLQAVGPEAQSVLQWQTRGLDHVLKARLSEEVAKPRHVSHRGRIQAELVMAQKQ